MRENDQRGLFLYTVKAKSTRAFRDFPFWKPLDFRQRSVIFRSMESRPTGRGANFKNLPEGIKRIGKGTGKRAPVLRAQARELMGKCQRAVPAWIMTIGTALV
ncbi:hypothetical protein GCM10008919_16010 [Selenomonas dianae]|uniref:Uncharacterized protein n=1 Tax=Selenomonas dianae TaxID=135079 RepID=A0ABN0T6A0_9FIRM